MHILVKFECKKSTQVGVKYSMRGLICNVISYFA